VTNNRSRSSLVSFKPSLVRDLSFYLALGLLVLVPLALSNSVYTKYALPKFVVLLIGSSALILLLALERRTSPAAGGAPHGLLRSSLVRIVCLYFLTLVLSTAFGVNPVGSLFGSTFNYIGLLTHACILIVFIAVIRGAGASEIRLRALLLTICGTGFVVGIYAVAQSFGIEPFVSRSTYTFTTPTGPLVRVCSTLGHSDYLGNFLLYTTLTTAALAVVERGLLRLLAIAATGGSVVAIALSGTRGAWFGLVAGVVVFAILQLRNASAAVFLTRRRLLSGAAAVIVVAGMVALSPAGGSAMARARALMNEGVSASGRVLLWRDSIKMVPAFPIIGCGPEGFRKAFLGFKSKELAHLSPTANNEDSHNSYLSAAISNGLVGAGLYVAMIVLALTLLVRARRREREDSRRIHIAGIIASFAAVLVHNIFIFDQISTALYFFAFLALAQVTNNVVEARTGGSESKRTAGQSASVASLYENGVAPRTRPKRRGALAIAAAGVCLVASIWYSAGLIASEAAYKSLLNPSNPVNYDGLLSFGERITSSPLPTRAYDYIFARAVYDFIGKLPTADQQPSNSGVDINAVRAQSVKLATEHVERSLADTFTPELNYSLLAALALAAGDVTKLRKAATAAVNADPNNYYTRWLMAEAYLAGGEQERAEAEALVALDLLPSSRLAAATLARARGANPPGNPSVAAIKEQIRKTATRPKRSVEAMIDVSRAFAKAGLLRNARAKLLTAIRRANGQCPDCHRELALVYEEMGRYSDAIGEWETYAAEAPERAAAEQQIKARLDALKHESDPVR